MVSGLMDAFPEPNKGQRTKCPSLLAELLATGTGAFSLHATSDFWAVWNAKILTVVREQLRPEGQARDTAVMARLVAKMARYRADNKK